jgi:hypothetical protein
MPESLPPRTLVLVPRQAISISAHCEVLAVCPAMPYLNEVLRKSTSASTSTS